MKKNIVFLLSFLLLFLEIKAQKTTKNIVIPLEKGEKIWSGLIRDAHKMPLKSGYKFDFYNDIQSNQSQPLILTNKGRYVWSEEPYAFELTDNQLIVSNIHAKIESGKHSNNLSDVQRYVAQKYFPASGKAPDSLLFARPQYNTWIELTWEGIFIKIY